MFVFPTHLFNPAVVALLPVASTIRGGDSITGQNDVVRIDGGGYWNLEYRGIELISADLIRAWRAWQDHLEDGVTSVIVPVADVRQAPRPIVAGRLGSPSAIEGDDESNPYFPEAVGFASPWIVASVVAAADLRATQLTIDVTRGGRIKGGETFALEHATKGRRVYRVGRVISRSGQMAVVSIRPPLREAIAAAAPVDFDWPSFVAALVPQTDISPRVELGRRATVDIVFRERF